MKRIAATAEAVHEWLRSWGRKDELPPPEPQEIETDAPGWEEDRPGGMSHRERPTT